MRRADWSVCLGSSERPDLRLFVSEFRRGILGGNDPRHWCFMVCNPLVTLLEQYGYPCRLVSGVVRKLPHYWIELRDGTVVDPTASQFRCRGGRSMPKVYIGPLPSWYKEKEEVQSLCHIHIQ